MTAKTYIEWSEVVWNPCTGCDKISIGCKYCYAERWSKRLQGQGKPKYANGFELTLHPDLLEKPYHWRKPRRVFVNSMSDLLHADVPTEFILEVFKVMNETPQHQYQVLTKRSERIAELNSDLPWSDNIWMGVSVEHSAYLNRIEHLRNSGAALKFLSLEPLLGPLSEMSLEGIDWAIVGGESGSQSRAMREEWVVEIRDKCLEAGVPFFFKQWGGKSRKKNGCLLQGETWQEKPAIHVR